MTSSLGDAYDASMQRLREERLRRISQPMPRVQEVQRETQRGKRAENQGHPGERYIAEKEGEA